MFEVNFKCSLYPSKFAGYQAKSGNKGTITSYISTIWDTTQKELKRREDPFELFVKLLNYIQVIERYCLERAFQKLRIKGGMCNPCCIQSAANYTTQYLFDLGFKEV